MRARKPILGALTAGAIDAPIAGASGAGIALLQRLALIAETSASASVQIVFASDRADNVLHEIAATDEVPLAIVVSEGFVAAVTRAAEGIVLHLVDGSTFLCRTKVTLAGAQRATARLFGDTLSLGDDRGRLVAIDLAHGGILRSQRV